MRHLVVIACLVLAACSPPLREDPVAEPVAAEAALAKTGCDLGDDDGIGGTGCQSD